MSILLETLTRCQMQPDLQILDGVLVVACVEKIEKKIKFYEVELSETMYV